MKIAVIGGGIFGCSAALELDRKHDVTIFEKSDGILNGATTHNHLRHHYGYHYPRSKETALESIKGRKSFEKEYRDCVIKGFPAYYAIAKEGSKSSVEEFLKFCDDLGLKYEEVKADPEIFDVSRIVKCLKTDEPAYDPDVLKEIVEKKLRGSGVDVKLGCEIVDGKILENGEKMLKIKNEDGEREEEFDVVISAIYTNFNKINKWFGFPLKKAQYALMELLDVRLPVPERIGAMIVDGDFSTFVPLREKGVVRLGHVKKSALKEGISDHLDSDLIMSDNVRSNKDEIIKESIKYFPIISKAEYLKSTFVTRIVKANVEDTDERPTEITSHGNGIFSIFGGKVITCVDTARELVGKLK
jgi:glycine/D-amino acid oxidase-like deaminating enzyme